MYEPPASSYIAAKVLINVTAERYRCVVSLSNRNHPPVQTLYTFSCNRAYACRCRFIVSSKLDGKESSSGFAFRLFWPASEFRTRAAFEKEWQEN